MKKKILRITIAAALVGVYLSVKFIYIPSESAKSEKAQIEYITNNDYWTE